MDKQHVDTIREALEFAEQFIGAAIDWNFDEAEINGEWVRATAVLRRVENARKALDTLNDAPAPVQDSTPNAEGLLPCPWCGGDATIEYRSLAYEVRCANRDCPGFSAADYETHDIAVYKWNKRTPQQGPTQEVIAAIEYLNNQTTIDWHDSFDAEPYRQTVRNWLQQKAVKGE